jgi:hypothetical protein
LSGCRCSAVARKSASTSTSAVASTCAVARTSATTCAPELHQNRVAEKMAAQAYEHDCITLFITYNAIVVLQ